MFFPMKTLIAGACLTIMAAGLYLALGEFGQYRQRAQFAAAQERARHELFSFADAQESEIDKVRYACKAWAGALEAGNYSAEFKSDFEGLVRNCRYFNYL